LFRHHDFLKLWSAQTVSQLGTQVTSFALPMVAILWLHASAFQVGALGAVQLLPFALIGLPAGVWVDRLPRRPILIAGDLGRALLLVTIPVGWALGGLTLGQLYLVAFGTGILTVFFDIAWAAYLPALVDRSRLLEGNSRMELTRSGAQMTGPIVAGELIRLIQAPAAIVVDTLSFLGSVFFVSRIRRAEPLVASRSGSSRRMRDEVREGLSYVLGHELLLPIAVTTALSNLSLAMGGAVYMIYVLRVLHLPVGMLSLVLGLGNLGFLIGAVSAKRMAQRFGLGRTIVGAAATFGLPLMFVLMAPVGPRAVPFLVVGGVIGSFGSVAYGINQVSLRQSVTPDELLGRMTATMRFLVMGVMPVGSLVGGILATALQPRTTLWITATIASVAFVPLLASRVPRLESEAYLEVFRDSAPETPAALNLVPDCSSV
jgi:MFS family permease